MNTTRVLTSTSPLITSQPPTDSTMSGASASRKLPKKGTRVNTEDGPGTVIDGKILVQLALVRLDEGNREIAVPVEELLP